LQFIGSYTASGTGPTGGNLAAVKAAEKQDMGVFIISPTDKGGALYEPPKSLYKVMVVNREYFAVRSVHEKL
jgi:predicted aldo/keto reductase-like oxidoreductase